MPPLFGVMSALIFAFFLGLGAASIESNKLKEILIDFGDIVMLAIKKSIIPLLPLFIFCVFLKLSLDGMVFNVLKLSMNVIKICFGDLSRSSQTTLGTCPYTNVAETLV